MKYLWFCIQRKEKFNKRRSAMQRNNNSIPLSIAICNFHNAVDIRMNEFSVLENKKLYSKTSKLQFSAGKRRWNIYAMHFSQNEIYLNLLEFQRTKCKIVSVFWFLMRKNCFSTVRLCFVNISVSYKSIKIEILHVSQGFFILFNQDLQK